MNPSLLLCEINSVQQHYQNLLLELLPYLNTSNALEMLDEVNIFWVRHIKTVQLYLETVPRNDTYVFTAVTRLDLKKSEHLPFLLFSERGILDDPLSKYSEICKKLPEGKNQKDLLNQIYQTVTDNLEVLTTLRNSLLVLPFRLLNQTTCQRLTEQVSLTKIGERLFVQLFQGIENLDDYFKKCSSIYDIQKYLKKDAEKFLKLTENDDSSLNFEERFRNAISQTEYFLDPNISDTVNFFRLVYGNIQQAVDVVGSCGVYRCIPYIRYPVTLHYVSWILNHVLRTEQNLNLHFKMMVAFVAHHYADKKKLTSVPLDEFLEKTKSYCFNKKLFNQLKESGINEKNFNTTPDTVELIKKELDSFYNFLKSDCKIPD